MRTRSLGWERIQTNIPDLLYVKKNFYGTASFTFKIT